MQIVGAAQMGEPELFGRSRRARRLDVLGSRAVRLSLLAVLLLDLTVLGVDGYLLHNRSTTTIVDLQDALVTFRSGGGGTITETSTPAGGAEAPGVALGGPVTAPSATPTTAPGAATPSPVPMSAPATPKAGALAPPQPGVYRYRTAGGESVSLLGASHTYPAETFAVIRQTGGCGWEIRAEVIEEHVDRRTMCSEADHVLQLEQERAITFFGTTDGGTYVCSPPQVQHRVGDAPGATATSICGDGDGASARMVRTTVRYGRATVGGVTVDTVTVRVDGTMTGRVRGTSMDLYTLVASTGLPIRVERSVDTIADAFGTSIRYQEQATFDLASLTPQT